MHGNLSHDKNFSISCRRLNLYNFWEKCTFTFPHVTRCKKICNKNKPRAVKVEASRFEISSGRLLYDFFLLNYSSSKIGRRYPTEVLKFSVNIGLLCIVKNSISRGSHQSLVTRSYYAGKYSGTKWFTLVMGTQRRYLAWKLTGCRGIRTIVFGISWVAIRSRNPRFSFTSKRLEKWLDRGGEFSQRILCFLVDATANRKWIRE